MFDLVVQRLACVLAEHCCDVMIELSVLVSQRHHRDADDREDDSQTLNVQFDQPSLTDASGQPVAHSVTTKSWLKGQSIIPHRPLQPGATYKATVRGKIDGKPFEYSWVFTTA